ncbi:MAG: hypothetical protein KJO30_13610 [Boseongicola sp.]|nr:hypothetical protein [Boseongicola sp.]NNJ67941.1 hypothetical protein [Boseongicola sp.]
MELLREIEAKLSTGLPEHRTAVRVKAILLQQGVESRYFGEHPVAHAL